MLFFVTKNVQVIDKNLLDINNEEKLRLQIKDLFREDRCETVLIYENNKYCGYIDRDDMYDIVIPEFYLGFEPVELEAGEELMEEIMKLWEKGISNIKKRTVMIPIKNPYSSLIKDFVVDGKYETARTYHLKLLKNLAEYVRNNEVTLSWAHSFERKTFKLFELDEFTYTFYKLIREKKQKCIFEGKYWNYINVYDEKTYDTDEAEILECTYDCIADLLEGFVKGKISEEINHMRQSGIKTYKIIIPSYDELAVHGELEEKIRYGLSGPGVEGLKCGSVPDRQFYIENLLKTEQCDTEEELLYSEHPQQYGEEDITIYLAGPCVVQGNTTTETASVAFMLYSKLSAKGMKYNVKRLVKAKHDVSLIGELRALDLKENDIIFFITDSHMYQVEPDDLYLLEDYDRRLPDEWWFANMPIHTLRRANEMITNKLYSIIETHYKRKSVEKKFIQVGRPWLSREQAEELKKYIDGIGFKKREGLSVGAVVMNANPYTKGHLYLLEKAAEAVDELLVFVVEEDLSVFPFPDRIIMVRKGTEHLKNVRVVPSGKFILSRHTFVSYFEKDEIQDVKVDAALDINFFGAYIAPAFGIGKRFVGEEPIDMVTRQYNEEMKRKLTLYGVEVVEIPRKKVGENFISATVVRRLYGAKDWRELAEYLPDSTLAYLKRHNVMMREKNNPHMTKNVPVKFLNGLKDILSRYKRIVFYSMGIDGRGLYGLLNEDEKGKVLLCDKRAETEEYFVERKKVYPPETLLHEFASYPILITSTQHGSQIRDELYTIGVSFLRIIQNTYSFYQK